MERVWRAVGPAARTALESGLSPSDLRSLLLDLIRTRARRVTPNEVLRRWREDRFVQPSRVDPRALAQLEARLWELLPARFAGVELSPVAPLGTCSAVSTIDQHQVVSTVRGTEVVSDPTNALAVEAAARRTTHDRVDLAACHRVLRAQPFRGPGQFAHFRLFVLVSSMRDQGGGTAEATMLADHLTFWARTLADLIPDREPRLTCTPFGRSATAERLIDTVLPAVTDVPIVLDTDRTKGSGYYGTVAVGLRALEDIDLGDGGTTDWTARLRGDAKERCAISCVATERLLTLTRDRSPAA